MSFIVTWLLLAGFWVGLSGYFDVIHLTFGAISVTLVTCISHKHLTGGSGMGLGFARAWRTILYLPWLFWQILIANVDVLLRVVGAREIEPMMIRYDADLKSAYGVTLLANSITLTPGTVTVEVDDDGVFLVHALSAEAAEGVLSRAMEGRVRKIEGTSTS